jgi:serine protease inhibitor
MSTDLTRFYEYQVTTRTTERFKQLATLMESNPNIRIRIPGFKFKTDKKYEMYETFENTDTISTSANNKLFVKDNDAKIPSTYFYHMLGTGIEIGRAHV